MCDKPGKLLEKSKHLNYYNDLTDISIIIYVYKMY